ESISTRTAARSRPQIQLSNPALLAKSEYETPTNLDSLFYYPHRWFFRQKLRLYRSSLLSVTGDNTLLGSLAHRFFEKLLKENIAGLDRRALIEWVENEASTLFPREGATLFLYGREPERMAFLNKVKNAAWSLVSLLRNNGWEVENTEMALEGNFGGIPVRGKADLVLRRGDEQAIIDLKWSGVKRRKELIQNGEDLQLVLYAHLLPPPEQWPHTAYFILDEGKMVARNATAFREAVVAGRGGDDHVTACTAIFDKMEKTYAWRLAQIKKGQIELRMARTALELEALYEGQLFDLLEMKNEDARWDDYRTLLG
ncbi:MAG: PD-(D/E)XK nuclease family protein, partial [Phycisphaerae bacterium]|nr:PD-(D/E)XK nuclease family protein [Saprospiraceae bacterium]